MKSNVERDENLRIRRLIEIDKSSLPPDGGPEFNRLIFTTSPYLLQHATNPVDWYPWGEEAFSRAASEDKPIFLSIGYATCHWCHAMEHESFEDREVAAAFNRSFVCIKVDREERPDIDEQYMAVAQMMTGSGGWPLNIFMTPAKMPFYAGTYIPRTPRMGLPGIIRLLETVADMWGRERHKLEESSGSAVKALSRLLQPHPGALPDRTPELNAFRQMNEMFDRSWGGFGDAPKFPMAINLFFLLRFWKKSNTAAPLGMVQHTLRKMRQGGICDQLGFGFHRYTVDRQWLIPHFEKMLYDQALLALACLETCQAVNEPFYLRMAEEIFEYLLREMVSPAGGFYSGQDADTEGEEGKCYLWTPAEVAAVIGQQEAALFCRLFDVTEKGNFEGSNILHLPISAEHFAAREGILPELLSADGERWRQELLRVREERVRPFRDEKALSAWNGLTIAALARGYALTGEERYLDAARQAADFVATKLTNPEGRLLRSYHLGQASIPAFLEDYAFVIWGLIELHQATLEQAFLDDASSLAVEMMRLFGDGEGSGLYETGSDAEQLLLRQKNAQDGVLPSPNGVAAMDLFRLGRIRGNERFSKAGEDIVMSFMGDAVRQPLAYLTLLAAADYHQGAELTVTLSGRREELGALLAASRSRFLPNLVLRYGGDGERPVAGGIPSAGICSEGVCRPPLTDADELVAQLAELG